MEIKKKIVVIDDEPDIGFFIKTVLEGTGLYTVWTAADGQQGLDICLREIPDLILLDFIMPKLNGNEVIKSLQGNPKTKGVPIVLTSGLGEMVYSQKINKWKWLPQKVSPAQKQDIPKSMKWSKMESDVMEELQVDAYLPKPFVQSALLSVVSELLERQSSGDKAADASEE